MSVDNDKEPKKTVNRGGRPEYKPNDKHYQIVRALCIFGASQKYISHYIDVSPHTLRKHYRELLDECMYDRNTEVETSLFYNAVVKKDTRAQMYWCDNNMSDTYNKGTTQAEASPADILKDLVDHLPD